MMVILINVDFCVAVSDCANEPKNHGRMEMGYDGGKKGEHRYREHGMENGIVIIGIESRTDM